MNMRTHAETVREAAQTIQKGMDMLRGGPFSFYLEELCGAVEYLMARFSPIKAGDRVELIEAPEISPTVSWGWESAKHFLVAGAKGTAQQVECGSNGICVYVIWDDESWVDGGGKRRPVDRQSLYCHGETKLRNITPSGVSASQRMTELVSAAKAVDDAIRLVHDAETMLPQLACSAHAKLESARERLREAVAASGVAIPQTNKEN